MFIKKMKKMRFIYGNMYIQILRKKMINFSFLYPDRKFGGYSDEPGIRLSINIFVSAL